MTEPTYTHEPQDAEGPSEQESLEREIDRWAKRDFTSSAKNPNHIRWRKEAENDFDFITGGAFDPGYEDGGSGQWWKEDVARLRQQNRPIITMNRTEPLIEGIVGAEVNNRTTRTPPGR